MGEFESPQKRRKSNFSENLNFGEGLETGTLSAMRNLNTSKSNLKLKNLDDLDQDPICSLQLAGLSDDQLNYI